MSRSASKQPPEFQNDDAAAPLNSGTAARQRSRSRGRRVPPSLRRTVQVLALLLAVHYLLVPLIAGARRSISVVSHLNPFLVVLGVAAQGTSLVAYAQLARTLVFTSERPGLWRILRIQLTTLGISHALPGGAAAATPLGYKLFRKIGITAPDAAFLLAMQAVGSAATLNAIVWVALVVSIPLRGTNAAYLGGASAGGITIASIALLLVLYAHGSRRAQALVRTIERKMPFVNSEQLTRFLGLTSSRLTQLASDRQRATRAVAWAATQWIADAASLWIFLAALGVYLEPDGLLIAFGMANLSAAIPLTPGGVGVYDAVLTSSLVAFGAPHPEAIIAVLCYRLFEFWIPIPIGLAAYVSTQADTHRESEEPSVGPTVPEPTNMSIDDGCSGGSRSESTAAEPQGPTRDQAHDNDD